MHVSIHAQAKKKEEGWTDGWMVGWLLGWLVDSFAQPHCSRLTSVAAAHCRQLVSGPTAQSHAFYMANNNNNDNNNSNTSNAKKKRYTNYVKRQQHEKNTRNKKLYICKSVYTIYICSVSLKYLKAGGATSLYHLPCSAARCTTNCLHWIC